MRTLTIKKGGGKGNFTPGWHTMTVSSAKYGTLMTDSGEAKYIDVWFEGYSENFTLRIYAKTNEGGEEWAIGQLFRFANAGLTDALDGPDGNVVIKLDDSAGNLKGHDINVFLYKDGEYSRALKRVAPTVFENDIESFNENDVEYWQGRAEDYYLKYIKDGGSANGSSNGFVADTTPIPVATSDPVNEEIPF